MREHVNEPSVLPVLISTHSVWPPISLCAFSHLQLWMSQRSKHDTLWYWTKRENTANYIRGKHTHTHTHPQHNHTHTHTQKHNHTSSLHFNDQSLPTEVQRLVLLFMGNENLFLFGF